MRQFHMNCFFWKNKSRSHHSHHRVIKPPHRKSTIFFWDVFFKHDFDQKVLPSSIFFGWLHAGSRVVRVDWCRRPSLKSSCGWLQYATCLSASTDVSKWLVLKQIKRGWISPQTLHYVQIYIHLPCFYWLQPHLLARILDGFHQVIRGYQGYPVTPPPPPTSQKGINLRKAQHAQHTQHAQYAQIVIPCLVEY